MKAKSYVTHAIGRDGSRERRAYSALGLRQAEETAARDFKGFPTVQTHSADSPMVAVIDAKWKRER